VVAGHRSDVEPIASQHSGTRAAGNSSGDGSHSHQTGRGRSHFTKAVANIVAGASWNEYDVDL